MSWFHQQQTPILSPTLGTHSVSTEPSSTTVPISLTPDNCHPPGTLRVHLLGLHIDSSLVKCSAPVIRIAVGDQQHTTSILDESGKRTIRSGTSWTTWLWDDQFSLQIDYHMQLFSLLQIDVLNSHIFIPDSLVARAELRVSSLCPPAPIVTSSIVTCQNSTFTASSWLVYSLPLFRPHHAPSRRPHLHSISSHISVPISPTSNVHITSNGMNSLVTPQEIHLLSDDESVNQTNISVGSLDVRLSYVPLHLEHQIHDDTVRRHLLDTEELTKDIPAVMVDLMFRALSLSTSTRRTLKQLSKVMAVFRQGIEHVSATEWMCGILIMLRYYETLPVPQCGKVVSNRSLFAALLHYKQYAMASYGWMGLVFFGKSRVLGDRRSMAAALPHILPADWLTIETATNDVFKPSYFIVHDRRENSLVICVRGTMSSVDAITDLLCEYARFKDGLVHRGIYIAADWLLATLLPNLPEWVVSRNIQSIVVVGHSLGGGTASLLTMLLQEYVLPGLCHISSALTLHCYAFGPPPVCSHNLAIRYRDTITTVVNQHDLVCRLSYGSVMDLRTCLLAAVGDMNGHALELFKLLSRDPRKAHEDTWLKTKFDQISRARDHLRATNENPKLYLAGTIYHIHYEHFPPTAPSSHSVPRSSPLTRPRCTSQSEVVGQSPSKTLPNPGRGLSFFDPAWLKASFWGSFSKSSNSNSVSISSKEESISLPSLTSDLSLLSPPFVDDDENSIYSDEGTSSSSLNQTTLSTGCPPLHSLDPSSHDVTDAILNPEIQQEIERTCKNGDLISLGSLQPFPSPSSPFSAPNYPLSITTPQWNTLNGPIGTSVLGLTAASRRVNPTPSPSKDQLPIDSTLPWGFSPVDEQQSSLPNPCLSTSESTPEQANANKLSEKKAQKTKVVLKELENDSLVELMVRRNMFIQHMPGAYERALGVWLTEDTDELGVDT